MSSLYIYTWLCFNIFNVFACVFMLISKVSNRYLLLNKQFTFDIKKKNVCRLSFDYGACLCIYQFLYEYACVLHFIFHFSFFSHFTYFYPYYTPTEKAEIARLSSVDLSVLKKMIVNDIA